jgi:MipA family protein
MKHLLVAGAAILPAWSAAAAQAGSDIRVRVGLGAQLEPQFIGADETRVEPLFHINIARGTNEFKFSAPDDSFGISVLSKGGFSFGPAGNIQAPRRQSDVGAPVGNVARTFEAGAFAEYTAGNSFRVRADILKGINGHRGLVGSIGADKIWRDGDRYVFSIGPRALFSDGRYQRAYFGVTPAASLESGLPTYRPHGGLYGVALASGVSYRLSGPWGLFGFARYERLVGDAGKSPIVRQFGSRNQLSGGVGLNYTFTIHP